jgi:hypothetical protein
VVIRFTAAEYANDSPGTRLDDQPEAGEQRYLYLDYDMEFEPGYPGTSEDFEVADFSLVLADGDEIVAEMVDFRRTILVQDDRPQNLALAFPGDGLDLAGAIVMFDNDINEPLVVPLDGPRPEDPYPIRVTIDESDDVVSKAAAATLRARSRFSTPSGMSTAESTRTGCASSTQGRSGPSEANVSCGSGSRPWQARATVAAPSSPTTRSGSSSTAYPSGPRTTSRRH